MIRRIQATDAPVVKAVRLRALATDPLSFASTYEREAALADQTWTDWAAKDASGSDVATFLAMRAAEPVGIVAAYRDEKRPQTFHVIAMWVAPEARREGIARRLLREVEQWIASRDGTCVQLSVADTALAACRLYETAGYERDGDVSESPHTRGVTHVSLSKRLVAT